MIIIILIIIVIMIVITIIMIIMIIIIIMITIDNNLMLRNHPSCCIWCYCPPSAPDNQALQGFTQSNIYTDIS